MRKLVDIYTASEFGSLIRLEGDQIELKSGTGGTPLQEALVALSNTSGGVVFVGVTDDREIKGRVLDQGTDDAIHGAAVAAHDLGGYAVRQVYVDATPVVAIQVAPREEGFAQTSNGRVLVRRGGRNQALLGRDLAEFLSSRALKKFERTSTGLAADQVDPELFAELASAYGWVSDLVDIDRLRERGLAAPSGDLTVAGALFLTDPGVSLAMTKAVVEVRRYTDDGADYDQRVVFSGPIQRQVRDTVTFIGQSLGTDLVVTGLYRYELQRLPEVVCREAVANAVAHRSYEITGTPVVVELRRDRVEIISPGRLPEPVTVETIRQAQAARNPAAIDVLRRFSLAEDAGRGIDVMEDTMRDAMLDPPVFAEDGGSVRVVLPLHGPITVRERAWITELVRRGDIRPEDRMLLVYAARGEVLTNSRAREILAVDSVAARQSLHRLRDLSLLEQQGDRGGATYTLSRTAAFGLPQPLTQGELEGVALGLARDSELTNERLRQATGLESRQALRLLNGLVAAGQLVRVGSRKATRYRLSSPDSRSHL